MITISSDDLLHQTIDEAATRSLAFFDMLKADASYPDGVLRFSTGHDVERWPGMLLPATYNGLMCLDLLGALSCWKEEKKRGLVTWFHHYRQENGVFRIPGMKPDAVFKKPDVSETWRYIDFHVTNYAQGAVQALDPHDKPVLDFVHVYLDPIYLKAWLAERDLRDPWQEGNNIVNLAGFLLLLVNHEDKKIGISAGQALEILFDWHDRLQEPTTGFWGVGQAMGGETLLNAMAGSMHNFHLWYATGRRLLYQDRAVDYVLSREPSLHSACIDVDEVDLLIHSADISTYRRADIDKWLLQKLSAIVSFQNKDGGFADTPDCNWRQDGWVRGPVEPAGVSTAFATWFRWIAIAMADSHLWPGRRSWRFKKMIGIGYRKSSLDG